MGTDNIELLDKRTAELIIHGSDDDLIALVECRTRSSSGPPVWREYWDADQESVQEFPRTATVEQRFGLISQHATSAEIKTQLVRELCTSDWLSLDYWGCFAEVFSGHRPPGSITWEEFIAPMFKGEVPEPIVHRDEDGSPIWLENTGRYLLANQNTDLMIHSLKNHIPELQVMGVSDVARFERWHALCARHSGFAIVYQIDF